MLGPWHTDAQTSMFSCGEKSYWKNGPMGELNRHQNLKLPKTQKYERTFIDQNI